MIPAAATLAISMLGLCTSTRPPAGTTMTAIRVHYPLPIGATLAIQSSPARSWSLDSSSTSPPDTYTFCASIPNTTDTVFFRALLNGTYSKGAAYRVWRGKVADVYPYFNSDTGQLVTLFNPFHSKVLGNDRTVWAYLPAGYAENGLQRYPVLYMHDGRNLFDAASSITGDEWEVDETMDAGIRSGAVEEAIVIAVDRTDQRMAEYVPVPDPGYPAISPLGDSYVRLLVEELKPQVDAVLHTDSATTGVVGSSLGGLISVHAWLQHPEIFSRVGALSPSVWWGDRFIANEASTAPPPSGVHQVYVDEGSEETTNATALADVLRSVGYEDGSTLQYFREICGYHTEPSWARRLPAALHFLYPGRGLTSCLDGGSATFVSQTVPTWMYAGTSITVSVVMRNTGLCDWTRDTLVRLGSQSPQDNVTWGLSRVELAPGEVIRPGESKTFQFIMKAPSTPGVYTFQWQMLQEGVVWFGGLTPPVAVTIYSNALCASCPGPNECPAVCYPPPESY